MSRIAVVKRTSRLINLRQFVKRPVMEVALSVDDAARIILIKIRKEMRLVGRSNDKVSVSSAEVFDSLQAAVKC
jgi:hypothetical protein